MDFDSATGFSDFFEALFGRASASGSRTNRNDFRRRVGDNIEQPGEAPLRAGYLGGTRTFNIQSTELCPLCRGTAEIPSKLSANCSRHGSPVRNKRNKY